MKRSEQAYENASQWADEPSTTSKGRSVSAVLSVRFSGDELEAVRRAADAAGERTSNFVRSAAIMRALGTPSITIQLGQAVASATAGVFSFPKEVSRTKAASVEFQAA